MEVETPVQRAKEDIDDVYDKIADVLLVLSDVASGDYAVNLDFGLPATHPLGALCTGINDMIAALGVAQEARDRYHREIEDKLATIEQQRAAIRELSTPIIEVWDGILCLPIVGIMDSARSSDMTDALLKAVVARRAVCAIIDITGIEVMDTGTADHFIRMAKAVRLLGSECVLTGLSPQIAQTIVHMGVDMSGIATHRGLRDAIQPYLRRRPGSPLAASRAAGVRTSHR